MKKRHLYAVFLSLLIVLVLVSPVFAESLLTQLPTEKPAEHDECADVSCEANTAEEAAEECDHTHLHENEGLIVESTVQNAKTPVSLVSLVCKHANAISYVDIDTNKTGYLCPACSKIWESGEVLASSAKIQTSAAIRLACPHSYTAWIRASATQHIRGCTLCAVTEYAKHSRVAATCTTDEYCRDCGTKESNWEDAWGHNMVWEYDWSQYPAEVHDYYCKNAIPSYYECEYVAVNDEPCTISPEWYVEVAVNGIHEMFQECTVCGNLTNFLYMECTVADGLCAQCDRLNPY